ncbi:hypothetical protein FSARC_11977 [Fusarium sarcochroum]|uniref:Xylanolytic transcriptional activator regulatory domain-containing protein n=1 Tax=Fusarium sarcochroum TaxID=1208366 RepID=A0A8H4WXY6_9HYPO|nr:hypothetical protein FSARC_11977 [Fusarium sarcochroum]
MIDELEKKEQTLCLRLQELEANPVSDVRVMDNSSPDDRHTVRSIAASSPATREGASLSFIAHLFADPNWRKSHATLLRTLADAPGAADVSIAPCSLPSAAETQQLFEKYLSWSHIQNPFLLRRSVWALHHRLFANQNLGYTIQLVGTSIWDVVRLCGRLCIELGLHNDTDIPNDLLQTQLRRRVFWQFYLIDRYSSTTLDRPFLIDDRDIETSFPVEASDEEIEAASQELQSLDAFNFAREPSLQNEMTVFFISVGLRRVSSHIQTEFSKLRREVANTSSKHVLAGHVHVVMTRLLKELKNWRSRTTVIQDPKCLYETQEWYDLLLARERLSVLRRAIDLVPKVNGSPPKEILTVFLRSALETIERYHNLCQKRDMVTHTRSYFHMLFTAGLSVMYCTSVSKKIKPEDLRASYEGLVRCQELLSSVASQLPDSQSYVSVFEALHRDVSQRLWPTIKDMSIGLPADASLTMPDPTNDLPNFGHGSFSQDLVTGGPDPLSAGIGNMPNFSSNRQFFDHSLNGRTNLLDPVSHFSAPVQAENGMSPGYRDGSAAVDRINWALLNYESLWNMESALGQYVYGDPTNPGAWEGFEF